MDYTELGYDKFLRKGSGITNRQSEYASSLRTEQTPQQNILAPLPKERIEEATEDLIKISSPATGGASVANNAGVRLITTISDSSNKARVMLGVCESTAYKGSIADGNEIPYGSDTIANNHKMATWYDFQDNLDSGTPGRGITYTHHIQNNSGSTSVYYITVRWRYLGKKIA